MITNNILNLIDVDSSQYVNELQKSTATSISVERRIDIWNFMLPIYEKLKEYSSLNFKQTDLYLTMTNNGFVKEEISNMIKKSGAHSWMAYLTPITEKFWIEGDFTFNEFLKRIHDTNIPNEWWDFHEKKRPKLCDE